MREHINEHRVRFDPTNEPDDFTFAYMKEQHERQASGKKDDVFQLSDVLVTCLTLVL
jgi:hypothetical protein